jgi:alkanesulfonate monooxygenase SsuD/methylene tetrahydromethanopterin reductase-like flavin-dependent oxidoreductase (luciferase family)
MKVGSYFFIQSPPGRSSSEIIRDEVDQMVLTEELGFDSVWLTEHHYADYGLSSAPSVLLATLAARTERVKLGMAVYVLPFHHPIRLAEETAMIDILSGGRLTVGIGRGNRPLEFSGHGVSLADSRSRTEEGVDVMLQAWTQERVNYEGKHWHFDNIPVYPKPFTQPHPPIAVAATSEESVRWTAKMGFQLLNSGLTTPLETTLKQRELYAQALNETQEPEVAADLLSRWSVTKHMYIAPTDEEARRDAEPAERWYADAFARSLSAEGVKGLPDSAYQDAARIKQRLSAINFDELADGPLLIGSPETVARKVSELQAHGVGELIMWMNFGGLDPAKVRRSMRLFASEVLPEVRRRDAAPVA